MTFLPVVARELSVMSRRKNLYWSRWITAVLALLVMVWLLAISSARVSFADLGSSIFLILSSLCFVFSAVVGMQATADSLSEEKREGTLGLLFLTDLKGFDVIAGKLAASSMHAILAVIGIIPMLSLALLLGGVTLRQFGQVAVVLLNTMFLSLALGVFVSSVSKNERKAMMGTFAALAAIILGPFGLVMALFPLGGFAEEVVAASPLYQFASIHTRTPGIIGAKYFWHSVAATHLLGWVCLVAASWILPRCVNELPARRLLAVRNFVNDFVYGRIEERKKHRATLLDRNAFMWLASRERVKPKYAWGVLAFWVGMYLWIGLQFPNMFYDLPVAIALIFLVHLVFKVWVASEVCSRLIQDRRGGALELLLSTPLSVGAIGEGQSLALRRIFLGPICGTLLLEGLLLWGGMRNMGMDSNAARVVAFGALAATFIADLWALKWVGLWLSMTGKSIERVLLSTIARVILMPWLMFLGAAGLLGFQMIVNPAQAGFTVVTFVGTFVAIAISIGIGTSARDKFLSQFRELASRQFDKSEEPEPRAISKPVAKKAPQKVNFLEIFRRRPVAHAVLLALGLTVSILWARGKYWSWKAGKELNAVTAQGFPISLIGVGAYYPAPLEHENGFTVLGTAGTGMPPMGSPRDRRLRGKPIERDALKTAMRGHARGLLGSREYLLKDFWTLPQFQRAYIDPTQVLWTSHYLHSGYSQLGEADLILGAGRASGEDSERTEKTVMSMIAHARLLRQQPLAFAQMCAGDSLNKLLSGLEFAFERNALSDEALERIQKELATVDDATALVRTLALQRSFFMEAPMSGGPGAGGGPGARVWMGAPPGLTAKIQWFFENLGATDKDKAQVLGDYRKAIEVAAVPFPKRLKAEFEADEMRRRRQFSRGFVPANAMIGTIGDVYAGDARFHAHLGLLRVAVALERYERKHGKMPSRIEMLVPEFLAAIPTDPYTGDALKSVKEGKGLLVYSVGADFSDDTAAGSDGRKQNDIIFTFERGISQGAKEDE